MDDEYGSLDWQARSVMAAPLRSRNEAAEGRPHPRAPTSPPAGDKRYATEFRRRLGLNCGYDESSMSLLADFQAPLRARQMFGTLTLRLAALSQHATADRSRHSVMKRPHASP
jgi:hypothetical protein